MMTSKIELGKCLISIVFLVLAYKIYRNEYQTASIERVLDGLLKEETFRRVHHETHRVAIGFGSCVDVISDGLKVLAALDIQPPSQTAHHDTVSSERELAEGFAYFFQYGAAAERFVDDPVLFQSWVEAAKSLPSSSVTIGGNAPVMAHRLALEGWSVLLGSIMKQDTLRMLHPSIRVAVGNDSLSDRDDVHLLLEYDIHSRWGDYVTPRANRYIVHSDYSNMMLDSLDAFINSLADFDPTLVIVSGLQMLDNSPYDPDVRTAKLKQLSKVLAGLPNTTQVHFEMASFTERRLMKELVEYVIPFADSLGMNEQELANLCYFIETGNITTVSDPYPRVATTLDEIRHLMELLSKQKPQNGRTLSRVHVHTLAFQALVITKQSDWRSMHAAIAKASLTANRHVCNSSQISIRNARLIMDDSFSVSQEPNAHRMPFIDSAPISCWNEVVGRICVAPNIVCTKVLKTGGGGDNVSAAGLALQL